MTSIKPPEPKFVVWGRKAINSLEWFISRHTDLDPDLFSYMSDIINLPDKVLQDCGLLPDSLDTEVHARFLQSARTEAKIKRTWLYYLLVNPKALPALPPDAEINLWKAEAEASVAALEVIEFLYKELEILHCVFDSPYQWWFGREYESFHTKMSLSGLIGEPLLWGKHKFGDERAIFLKQFMEPKEFFEDDKGDVTAYLNSMAAISWQDVLNRILSGEIQEDLSMLTPNNILWLLGVMAAADDPDFRDGPWEKMIKAYKRSNRVYRNQSHFSVSYLLADGSEKFFNRGRQKKTNSG